eukprot:TRINITY_DN81768_c0_g1_i1.p1 TRINITY_DN81768_c0_g1~~TRINITY_DN81768_c0_g1_i1.p1  ORF type:complete len:231 (+),score=20.68 TRINITY_DN81768_c0_g1_i1:29-721(+)
MIFAVHQTPIRRPSSRLIAAAVLASSNMSVHWTHATMPGLCAMATSAKSSCARPWVVAHYRIKDHRTRMASTVARANSFSSPPPFKFKRLDHVVLRCHDMDKMLIFYINVLGAEADWLNRFDGCLSHLRIGDSLIDLQAYNGTVGRKMHAAGSRLPDGAPLPKRDPEQGTLDHFAISMEPYDPDVVERYLSQHGFPPFSKGERYGAEGIGHSLYVRDPEGNILELKSSAR